MAKHAAELGEEGANLRWQHAKPPEAVLFVVDVIIGTIN